MDPDLLQEIAIRVPIVLLSLSVHESAHAWVADRCGDPTARLEGRITLNPLAHLDPMGTLCMIWARFGWAKPVPVNPYNLRNPRRDDILVSAAGPASNFAMALGFGIVFRIVAAVFGPALTAPNPPFIPWLIVHMALEGVVLSCALGIFNLVPIFPLDGSHVLKGLLPPHLGEKYESLNPVMPIALLILVFSNQLGVLIGPPIFLLVSLFTGIPMSHM
ncbi:MAG: site-2 protease family protein [Planctomycetota bacterium]